MNAMPMIDPQLLERMVNASEDGIVIAEQEGDENILIYVNQGFEKLTGYTADEILYQDCRFLQGDDKDQSSLDKVRKAIKEKSPAVKFYATTAKTVQCFGMSFPLRRFLMTKTNLLTLSEFKKT